MKSREKIIGSNWILLGPNVTASNLDIFGSKLFSQMEEEGERHGYSTFQMSKLILLLESDISYFGCGIESIVQQCPIFVFFKAIQCC